MKYIQHYSQELQAQVQEMVENKKLGHYLKKNYQEAHQYNNDKTLYQFVNELKNQYFRKYQISKVMYDGKINIIDNALGKHTFISRVQGNKLKAKNEIRIATLFKKVPEEFLTMIVVHELAHLKEKEHDKAFYKLCTYMYPSYHQVEFDLRLYLIHLDRFGKLY